MLMRVVRACVALEINEREKDGAYLLRCESEKDQALMRVVHAHYGAEEIEREGGDKISADRKAERSEFSKF